jgi:hypothetical protein
LPITSVADAAIPDGTDRDGTMPESTAKGGRDDDAPERPASTNELATVQRFRRTWNIGPPGQPLLIEERLIVATLDGWNGLAESIEVDPGWRYRLVELAGGISVVIASRIET